MNQEEIKQAIEDVRSLVLGWEENATPVIALRKLVDLVQQFY